MGTIIFDTETTGLIKPDANNLKDQPYITEFYGVKPETGEKLHLLMKPPVPLSAEITRITGLTNEMLEGKPSFADCYGQLAGFFLGTHTLVAHNLAFDRSMMANELLRIDKVLNFPWPYDHICTVERSMYIEQRRLNLTRLHEYATGQSEIPDAHRAFGDVNALVKCYLWLQEQGKIAR